MSTPAQQAKPGWYNDGSGRYRWWDGRAWTNQFAPAQPVPQQARPAVQQAPQRIQPQMPVQQPQYVPVQYAPQPQVVVNQRKMYKTSHGFHLIMSIVTLGFWLPVWLIVGLYNAAKS